MSSHSPRSLPFPQKKLCNPCALINLPPVPPYFWCNTSGLHSSGFSIPVSLLYLIPFVCSPTEWGQGPFLTPALVVMLHIACSDHTDVCAPDVTMCMCPPLPPPPGPLPAPLKPLKPTLNPKPPCRMLTQPLMPVLAHILPPQPLEPSPPPEAAGPPPGAAQAAAPGRALTTPTPL